MVERLIDVANLAKAFEERPVVEGVTLTLAPGEIVGLVGANGGGKTTTLRMIGGLLRPDAGEGVVLGEDVLRAHPQRRGRIGYMGQRLSLYPDLTVLENLRFHADVHALTAAHKTIAAAVDRYGLRPFIDKRFGQLSGGWARRVQFVCTILHAPPLLLLDEPTAGFDPVTRHDIWDWLDELAAQGTGIIVSTHDLAEAERCPSVLLYHDRRAWPQQSPQALLSATGAATLEQAVMQIALA